MVRKKFLRSKWRTYSKLGRRRKKKQKWRKPKGRDTKMRLQKKGNPKIVKIGYKKQKKKTEPVIRNIRDLAEIKKGERIILGKFGKKKKLDIIKKVKEKDIKIVNLNIEKFLEQIEREKQKIEKRKEEKEKKKSEKKKGKRKEEEKEQKKPEEKKQEKEEEKEEPKEEIKNENKEDKK